MKKSILPPDVASTYYTQKYCKMPTTPFTYPLNIYEDANYIPFKNPCNVSLKNTQVAKNL